MEQIRTQFKTCLQTALGVSMEDTGIGLEEIVLERPKNAALGDFAFPCFRAAKLLGKNPAQLAGELACSIKIEGAECVAAGPYLNLKLHPLVRARSVIQALLNGKPYGSVPEPSESSEKVLVEYSSPNIAKLFTIGHLRTTMIGHALVQTNKYLGCQVVRLNHLGDWGTQFGTLLAAYKRWAEGENPTLDQDFPWAEEAPEARKTPLFRLLQLYVRFHAEEENDASMREEARQWFKRLEEGDSEARRLWSWFREISLKEFQRIYDRLGVQFDSMDGEAFYEDKLSDAVARLRQAHLLETGEGGAQIVRLEDMGIQTPSIMLKADGASIYATRDLAAALYRQKTYDFDRCLYVVGNDQILHFQQLFAVLAKLDPWFQSRMMHIPFGMVKLPDGKMSTRKGNVIFLEDVLDEAVSRVLAIIEEKNPDLANKAEIAEMLGMGAVVFFDALNDRVKPITFTWDRVIALEGDTGPYVQYAHARICSVLRKAGGEWATLARPGRSFGSETPFVPFQAAELPSALAGLEDVAAQNLVFELAGLPEAINTVQRENMATALARQLLSIAKVFSSFYTQCPILWSENSPEVRDSRLSLCVATARALRQGLFLMGIKAPEEM